MKKVKLPRLYTIFGVMFRYLKFTGLFIISIPLAILGTALIFATSPIWCWVAAYHWSKHVL